MTVLVNFPDLSARASWLIATLLHEEYLAGIPSFHWRGHPRASSLRSTCRAPLLLILFDQVLALF